MEIKILGTGCAKCKTLYATVEKTVRDAGSDAKVTKVEDMADIMQYDVMSTPAVVVDGKVVSQGKIPSAGEILKFIGK